MAIPAGGAPEHPLWAGYDWVEVQAPSSTATARMQRGAWERYWGPVKGFALVRTLWPVIPDGA